MCVSKSRTSHSAKPRAATDSGSSISRAAKRGRCPTGSSAPSTSTGDTEPLKRNLHVAAVRMVYLFELLANIPRAAIAIRPPPYDETERDEAERAHQLRIDGQARRLFDVRDREGFVTHQRKATRRKAYEQEGGVLGTLLALYRCLLRSMNLRSDFDHSASILVYRLLDHRLHTIANNEPFVPLGDLRGRYRPDTPIEFLRMLDDAHVRRHLDSIVDAVSAIAALPNVLTNVLAVLGPGNPARMCPDLPEVQLATAHFLEADGMLAARFRASTKDLPPWPSPQGDGLAALFASGHRVANRRYLQAIAWFLHQLGSRVVSAASPQSMNDFGLALTALCAAGFNPIEQRRDGHPCVLVDRAIDRMFWDPGLFKLASGREQTALMHLLKFSIQNDISFGEKRRWAKTWPEYANTQANRKFMMYSIDIAHVDQTMCRVQAVLAQMGALTEALAQRNRAAAKGLGVVTADI